MDPTTKPQWAHQMLHAYIVTPKLPTPTFELHTSGSGSKLLLQMGYIGGGLGKNGQGITNPIYPMMRSTKSKLGLWELQRDETKMKL